MNIITESFNNDVNLAICVFPADTLNHQALKDKMMDYTTFYALRFNQLVAEGGTPIDIYHAESIEAGLHDLTDKYDHVLMMAAGSRILDMSVIFDIKEVILNNDNYLVGAHILDWKASWYELHHQFLLVNSKKWIAAGSPIYGGWDVSEADLPIIERSEENFHDDYTPLWIRFTGEYKTQYHQKQGWNFIAAAAKNGYDVFNWDAIIRNKRTYYYPESQSEELYQSLTKLEEAGISNPNQKNLIKQCNTVKDQIWVLNSENMTLEIEPEKFDTLVYTASGFKFLDTFHSDRINEGGKIVIYDFNQKSLDWISILYSSTEEDVRELMKTFEHRNNFKFYGNKMFSQDGIFTKEFVDSFNVTVDYFGGKDKFLAYLREFRKARVEFVQVNLFDNPQPLVDTFEGNTVVNLSNIYCTDFTNAYFGMSNANKKLKDLIAMINNPCLVLGQDAYCRPMKKRINYE